MHAKCPAIREYYANSNFLQEVFGILFPVIVSSDSVSAETELKARDSALTFDGGDVVIKSISSIGSVAPPIVRTVTIQDTEAHISSPVASRSSTLRRASSFVLVTSEPTAYSPSSAKLFSTVNTPAIGTVSINVTNAVVESLLELVVAVSVDLVMERREFSGFNLFTKVSLNTPPCAEVEYQQFLDSSGLSGAPNLLRILLA